MVMLNLLKPLSSTINTTYGKLVTLLYGKCCFYVHSITFIHGLLNFLDLYNCMHELLEGNIKITSTIVQLHNDCN